MNSPIDPQQFQEVTGFEWDDSNVNKNLIKHKVTWQEIESTFRNRPIVLFTDAKHSDQEDRYTLYGQTDQGRQLTVVFTIREDLFRVISARDQSKKERKIYAQAKKDQADS